MKYPSWTNQIISLRQKLRGNIRFESNIRSTQRKMGLTNKNIWSLDVNLMAFDEVLDRFTNEKINKLTGWIKFLSYYTR